MLWKSGSLSSSSDVSALLFLSFLQSQQNIHASWNYMRRINPVLLLYSDLNQTAAPIPFFLRFSLFFFFLPPLPHTHTLSLTHTHTLTQHTHSHTRTHGAPEESGGAIGWLPSCASLDTLAAVSCTDCCANKVSSFLTLKGETPTSNF